MAAIGSTPGEAPPQIIEIEAVGAIAVLLENLSLNPYSAASGHAPRSSANSFDALFTCSSICLNIFYFQDLAITDSSGILCFCKKEWKPITPRPTLLSLSA